MGRPKLSEVDRLRAKIWYRAVKHCSNWSDYRLDMQFGQEEGPMTLGGAGRNRVFGVIKNKGTLPSRGNHTKRTFDLVNRVENHPQFKGTIDVIDSPFWDLLKLPSRDLEETVNFVSECLERLGLKRVTGDTAIQWMWYDAARLFRTDGPSIKSTGATPYEVSLTNAMAGMPCNLSSIALLGGLYREACLSFNHQNIEILGISFRLALEEFCSQQWLDEQGAILEDLARNRILYGKSDYLPSNRSSGNDAESAPTEIQSRGFIVASQDPLFRSFIATPKEVISSVIKCWSISLMSDEHVNGTPWNEPLTDRERALIQEFKKKGSR